MEATRYSTDHTSEDMFLGCMPYRQQNGSNAGIRAILQDRDGVGATLLCRGETREQAELVKRRDPIPSVQQRIDFTDALRRAPSASACFDLIGRPNPTHARVQLCECARSSVGEVDEVRGRMATACRPKVS